MSYNSKPDINNFDLKFNLSKTVKSGNYSISRKLSNGSHERIKYTIYNMFLPFGREIYNNKYLINGLLNDQNNTNYNMIVHMKKITEMFENMKKSEKLSQKYDITDKTFYPFIKKVDMMESSNDEYIVRMYFKNGVKFYENDIEITDFTYLKGKYCNIDVELGSLWINDKINKFGINIYVTKINILTKKNQSGKNV